MRSATVGPSDPTVQRVAAGERSAESAPVLAERAGASAPTRFATHFPTRSAEDARRTATGSTVPGAASALVQRAAAGDSVGRNPGPQPARVKPSGPAERPPAAGPAAVGYAPAPQRQVDLFVLHRSEATAPPAVQRALTPDRPALVAPILADRAPPAGPKPITGSEPRSASAGPSTRTGSTDSRRREAAVQRSGPGGPVGGLRKPAPVQRRSTGAGLLPAGAVAVAAGQAREVTGGSIVFHPPDRSAPVRTASAPPNVQRANPVPPPLAPPPPAPPDSITPSVVAAPAGMTRDRASRPSGSAPAVLDAKALDQLAGRLYDPLLSRLRAELWSDRERAGLLADTW
jgi:hypothetical protein